MKSLAEAKTGTKSKIVGMVSCQNNLIRRMSALGFYVGKEIEVLRTGWIRPIHVRVGMTEVMIRKSDAKNIWVE